MSTNQVLLPEPLVERQFENRIADEVLLALRHSGYTQLPELEIRVDGQNVFLRGRLPSYYLKQKAHHAVLKVPGVHRIIDEINIVG